MSQSPSRKIAKIVGREISNFLLVPSKTNEYLPGLHVTPIYRNGSVLWEVVMGKEYFKIRIHPHHIDNQKKEINIRMLAWNSDMYTDEHRDRRWFSYWLRMDKRMQSEAVLRVAYTFDALLCGMSSEESMREVLNSLR